MKTQTMNESDYKLLELLLGKLENELGHRFCIVPNVIQDGYHMAIYDNSTGEIKKQAMWATIQETVKMLLSPPLPSPES